MNKKYDLIISLNVLNYFKYSQIDNIINLIRNKSEKNFIIIETISNLKKRKQFLSSDPNYKISETQEWWNTKFKKLNFNINNIFYRDMV